MAESITVRDNGPYLVQGGLTVLDGAGNALETQDVVALCRCGHSANKPFCDGGHSRAGFESEVRS